MMMACPPQPIQESDAPLTMREYQEYLAARRVALLQEVRWIERKLGINPR